jgi:hypothetical protein
MDEPSAPPSAIEKAKNGRDIFTDKIADEIVSACGSGFTLEKAGALVGVNPSTIRTWAQRKPDFGKRVETARKKHELSLLRDIQLAGEKSWQAKAWLAERIYNHGVPSARLQVSQDVTHGISGNLAQLLAGIRGRKQAEPKPAQVIESEPANISQKGQSKHNVYCATLENVQSTLVKLPRKRKLEMRRRKPRAESLAKYPPTTTPPLPPPAAV